MGSYLHNGEPSDCVPGFVVRLDTEAERYLIAEIQGTEREDTAEVKAQAAHR